MRRQRKPQGIVIGATAGWMPASDHRAGSLLPPLLLICGSVAIGATGTRLNRRAESQNPFIDAFIGRRPPYLLAIQELVRLSA
jgi:uncharacterized membrane protein YeaQ/YmgE (transglycosylase-associated protein family)